ncbi:hypothetical protein AAFF_G00351660 [Aldrovandia affinis]|uniref:Uncharacterized protein n=1 Tax=Aldrovandia affinis TaxID=143900 RepID=A0AAD7WPB6_9TELE|nr:hypothetical protein AAFF_G00351660 [Aldrovandia affinis]
MVAAGHMAWMKAAALKELLGYHFFALMCRTSLVVQLRNLTLLFPKNLLFGDVGPGMLCCLTAGTVHLATHLFQLHALQPLFYYGHL